MFDGLTKREIFQSIAGAIIAAPIVYGYTVAFIILFGGRGI